MSDAVIFRRSLAIAVSLPVLFTTSGIPGAPASAHTSWQLSSTELWLVYGWVMAQRDESGLTSGGSLC